MTSNILVIAPHPDDEILGCGATIRKKVAEGHSVIVFIMTNANKSLPERYTADKLANIRREAEKSHQLLGVKETIYEDFPAPMLDQVPIYKVAEAIAKVINEKKIDTMYIPHRGDIHNDHKVIFDAAMVACRPVGHYTVKKVFAYETLSETEWAHPFPNDAFIPTCYEVIDTATFNYKLEAMKCYSSQLRSFPASRSLETIEALAKFRGATVNTERAEAFMLLRSIQ